jgi:hypothetical protein
MMKRLNSSKTDGSIPSAALPLKDVILDNNMIKTVLLGLCLNETPLGF